MNKNLHNHIRNSYDKNKYWNPGMPLSDDDLKMLKEVELIYKKQGFVPTKDELPISSVSKLKSRFRTWGNVLTAAGLPGLNDPEEKRKRMESIHNKKNVD